jgi:hypothetical protein
MNARSFLGLATSKIVKRCRVAARFEGAPPPFDHAGVVAGFVGWIELGPDLPATGLIRLPDGAAHRERWTRIGRSSDESSVVCQSLPRTGEAEMRPEQVAEKGVMR